MCGFHTTLIMKIPNLPTFNSFLGVSLCWPLSGISFLSSIQNPYREKLWRLINNSLNFVKNYCTKFMKKCCGFGTRVANVCIKCCFWSTFVSRRLAIYDLRQSWLLTDSLISQMARTIFPWWLYIDVLTTRLLKYRYECLDSDRSSSLDWFGSYKVSIIHLLQKPHSQDIFLTKWVFPTTYLRNVLCLTVEFNSSFNHFQALTLSLPVSRRLQVFPFSTLAHRTVKS